MSKSFLEWIYKSTPKPIIVTLQNTKKRKAEKQLARQIT